MSKTSDYPSVGVMPWKEWCEEVLFYLGLQEPSRLRNAIKFELERRPFSLNPWRQCFARYVMTPGEAIKTMKAKHDPSRH